MSLLTSDQVHGLGTMAPSKNKLMPAILDLFNGGEIEHGLMGGRVLHYMPKNTTESQGPFHFDIPSGAENQYLQLSGTRIIGEIKLTTEDSIREIDHVAVPAATADNKVARDALIERNKDIDLENASNKKCLVAGCNTFFHSLWRSIEIYVNGVQLASLNSNNFHYKAYIEHALSYSMDAAKNSTNDYFWPCGYTQNDYFVKTGMDVNKGNVNTGPLEERFTKAFSDQDNIKPIKFCIPLSCDFFSTTKLLPSGIDLRITLQRNPDNVSLMYDANELKTYKIEIPSLKLAMRTVDVEPSVVKEHREQFAKGALATYPFTKTVLKTFPLATKDTLVNIPGINKGILPETVVIGWVKTAAFNGAKNLDPFCFSPYGIQNYTFMRNGRVVTGYPYVFGTDDYTDNACQVMYKMLLDNVGIKNENTSLSFHSLDWAANCCFFVHDMSPDQDSSFIERVPEQGEDSLSVRYDDSNVLPITIIAHNSYQTRYYVTGTPREIIVDNTGM